MFDMWLCNTPRQVDSSFGREAALRFSGSLGRGRAVCWELPLYPHVPNIGRKQGWEEVTVSSTSRRPLTNIC